MLLYATSAFVRFYTIYGLAYALAVSLIFFVASKLKYNTIIWILSVVAMFSLQQADVLKFLVGICLHLQTAIIKHSFKFSFLHFKKTKLNSNRPNSYQEFVIIYKLMILRLVSFSMDKIDSLRLSVDLSTPANYSLLNFLAYIFFPTFLTITPFVSFKKFILCVSLSVNYMDIIQN